ncbi:mannose-6-phosphate isomerase, class I [Enterococcus faecium]
MQEPMFLKPVFQEKIWGGSRLRSVFGFDIPNDKIGEDWAISAHPHGVSVVENGEFKGKRLDELWSEHSAEIIYGHHAKTREELAEMIKDGRWDDLLKKVPVKKGDFFYVPSGTIHAIGKGIMILETQQSSDTTYRVYDYDRKDAQGQTRELHIQQSIDVTTVPAKTPELQIKEVRKGNSSIVTYLETEFFNVYEWDIKGITSFKKQAPYTLMTVIEGAGDLVVDGKTYPLEKGTSCIIPNGVSEWAVQGELAIIATEPGK